MARAKTTTDPMGPIKSVPVPKFQIGQKVAFDFQHPSDKDYFTRKYVRHMLRESRRVINSLIRQGHFDPGKLPSHTKEEIKECARCVYNAKEFTIIGIKPWSSFNIDTVKFNECYIGGVTGASSPLTYEYHIMVQFTNKEGNKIALVTGCPVGSEGCFKAL